MAPRRVLHLVGSPTSEFYCDLSRLYASDCLASTADPSRYAPLIAYVTPDGLWRFPARLAPEEIAAAAPTDVAAAIARISSSNIAVVVPQMFCPEGMTAYRALFDVLRIPYVGNQADVMALTMDKAKAKAVVAAAGVDVPRGELLRPGAPPTVAPPSVVKPVDADNSLGVTYVVKASDYPAALRAAFCHSPAVLVEDYIELGREVRCGILERDGALECLPLEEYAVDTASKPVRGHDDKIRGAGDAMGLVAKDSTHAWIVDRDDPITSAVWDAARRCHAALGCRDYSLFDFRIDPDGQPWFLEASLYCSFAAQSVLVVMAAAAGIRLADLFGSYIEARAQAAAE
jgi:D-alanine-D-alanine ligase